MDRRSPGSAETHSAAPTTVLDTLGGRTEPQGSTRNDEGSEEKDKELLAGLPGLDVCRMVFSDSKERNAGWVALGVRAGTARPEALGDIQRGPGQQGFGPGLSYVSRTEME